MVEEAINSAVAGENVEETITTFQGTVDSIDPDCHQRYHDALKKAQEEMEKVNIVLEVYCVDWFILVTDNC